MQSRNPRLPRIDGLTTLDRFLDLWPEAALADPDGVDGPLLRAERTAIAIGPEGGFSPAELHGRAIVRLPGRILRTETAAITAAVLLTVGRTAGG